jgi:2-polyprenyl-6-methoxyphenol hydroxylase-like FAD-dependent oxidoreductase
VLHHDLYELPRLKTSTVGNVVLAGDAAHAMTPNLGQGACRALEDAVVLGAVMASGGGLDAYDRHQHGHIIEGAAVAGTADGLRQQLGIPRPAKDEVLLQRWAGHQLVPGRGKPRLMACG